MGDDVAHSVGVTSTPDVIVRDITDDMCFIVVASDGVWEFLSNDKVKDIVLQYYNRNDPKGAAEWIAGGVPITMMMNIERRNGANKPVIRKALVELDGAPFKFFASKRDEWAKETAFVYPGPIQYWGPSEVCDQTTKTLLLEQAK